jgi:hypothetical protein
MGGRGSGRIAAENEWVDKPWWLLDSVWLSNILH